MAGLPLRACCCPCKRMPAMRRETPTYTPTPCVRNFKERKQALVTFPARFSTDTASRDTHTHFFPCVCQRLQTRCRTVLTAIKPHAGTRQGKDAGSARQFSSKLGAKHRRRSDDSNINKTGQFEKKCKHEKSELLKKYQYPYIASNKTQDRS